MNRIYTYLCFLSSLVFAQDVVTDVNGNTYQYLTYGTQQWTIDNAAMESYRDGTPIEYVEDLAVWSTLTTGAWCYYDNDPNKGKLYNWYAVVGIHDNDPNTPNKEFAPEGWEVPGWSISNDFGTIINYLEENNFNCTGQDSNGGIPGNNKLAKAVSSTNGWFENGGLECAPANTPSLNNSSGFSAFPTGYRTIDGIYANEGSNAFFWTIRYGADDEGQAYFIERTWDYLGSMYMGKTFGASVRFVRPSQTASTNNLSQINFSIHPNPVGDYLYIDALSTYLVTVYDIFGKVILKTTTDKRIDVRSLSQGVYFIKVANKSESITKKIIKK